MIKQVIVVRKDLNFSVEELMSYVSQASIKVFLDRSFFDCDGCMYGSCNDSIYCIKIPITKEMKDWITNSFGKEIVEVNSEYAIEKIYRKALTNKIPASIIMNRENEATVSAVGPANYDLIKGVIGDQKRLTL